MNLFPNMKTRTFHYMECSVYDDTMSREDIEFHCSTVEYNSVYSNHVDYTELFEEIARIAYDDYAWENAYDNWPIEFCLFDEEYNLIGRAKMVLEYEPSFYIQSAQMNFVTSQQDEEK